MYFASSHNQKKDNNKYKTKKFKNENQNCQKIELNGSPTTKDLKKKHSPRPVGGAEMGSQGGEGSQQGGGWRTQRGGGLWRGHARLQLADPTRWWLAATAAPHSCIDKPGGMEGGGKQTSQPRAPAWGNKASKPLIKNTHGG